MSERENDETAIGPKPYVFVLMPFDQRLEDIYLYGIKAAADSVGAYAERADELMFDENILEKILNEINKADVVVADMTFRNPNVFYEVGYAHALRKLVILLTQDVNDIPFDLKQRRHIVYGSIKELLKLLTPTLEWAVERQIERRANEQSERVSLEVDGGSGWQQVPNVVDGKVYPDIALTGQGILMLRIKNESQRPLAHISHVSLLMDRVGVMRPEKDVLRFDGPVQVSTEFGIMSEYRIKSDLRSIGAGQSDDLPIGYVRESKMRVGFKRDAAPQDHKTERVFFVIRLWADDRACEFAFNGLMV